MRIPSRALRVLGVALALALTPRTPLAHEIPLRVGIVAFVRPDAQTLHLLVRVPLEAMRDVDFPLRADGTLDLPRLAPLLQQAAQVWVADGLRLFEDGAPLPVGTVAHARVAPPSDKTFDAYATAAEHMVAAPLDSTAALRWQVAFLDVALDVPITDAGSRFSVEPSLARLGVRTTTVMHFTPPGGVERVYEYVGDPGRIHLDPRWWEAAASFVRLGFWHILGGFDHLLFVVCLVLPIRRIRPLVAIITAFTLAHSITLVASSLGFAPTALWFPPLVELLIAASILWMAIENIAGRSVRPTHRWRLAFAFGLVHGFGFSFALRESLQFAGSHLAVSLGAFNLGVELGQLLVLVALVPVLGWLFTRVLDERMGTIVLSALIAHSAWHWITDRGAALAEYRFAWPAWDATFALEAVRLALVAAVAVAVGWGATHLRAIAPSQDP
jgi:hypothetical protein